MVNGVPKAVLSVWLKAERVSFPSFLGVRSKRARPVVEVWLVIEEEVDVDEEDGKGEVSESAVAEEGEETSASSELSLRLMTLFSRPLPY